MPKEKITKEFILEYLTYYYEKNKKIPLSKYKEHPFSDKTVRNKFGTWNDNKDVLKMKLFVQNYVLNILEKMIYVVMNKFLKIKMEISGIVTYLSKV